MSNLTTSVRVAVALFMVVGIARGQSQFGSIAGHVTDPSQAVVPGAQVQATNEATKVASSALTNNSGTYVIPGLLPGTYTVSVQATGFKEFRLTGVAVRAARTTGTDIQVELGATQEQLTVSAEATQINTQSGSLTVEAPLQLLDMPAILPQATQTYADTLVPYLQGQQYVGGRQVAAYGSRSYDRRINLDGVAYGFQNTSALHLPRGTIEELQVTSVNASAEHHTANTNEMTTAKGTNDFHGAVWTEIQNSALNALAWYQPPGSRGPGLPTVGYGLIAGGPVFIPKVYDGRNKTFFHGTFQKFVGEQKGLSAITVPTTQMISAGDFSQLLPGIQLVNPWTSQPFPNNQINSTTCVAPCQISTQAAALLKLYPPNNVSPQFINNNGQTTGHYEEPFNDYFVRMDQQFGSKDNLHGTFGSNHQLIYEVNSGIPEAGFDWVDRESKFISAAWNHIFNPNVLNEAAFGLKVGNNQKIWNSPDGATLVNQFGLPQPLVAPPEAGKSGGPIFNITGISGFNPQPLGTSETRPRTWTVRNTASWVHGRFTTKAGFEMLHFTSRADTFPNLWGTFNFDGKFTGNAVADLFLGLPAGTSRSQYPAPTITSQYDYAYFGTVDARLTRKLTMNFGVRIQQLTPVIETDDKYYNFDRATGNLVVPSQESMSKLNPGLSPEVLAHIVTAESAGFPDKLLKTQTYIQPRIGFAYQIQNDTVVRGGFGLYANLLNAGGPVGGPFTPGVQNFTNICSGAGGAPCTPSFTLNNPFPGGVAAVSGLNVSGINPDIKRQDLYQWNLTVERRLPADFVFRTTYTGSSASNLWYRANINLPPASTIPFSQSRLVYPLWFSTIYTDSGANSSYNALDLAFTRQWANGLTVDGGYSLVKCISTADEGGLQTNFGSFGLQGPTIETAYDLGRERGNCQSYPRHRFRTMYSWAIPVGKGRTWLNNPQGFGGGVLNQILGGWTWSGNFIATSGRYFTPYWTGFDAANTGQTLIRADAVCSGVPANQEWDHIFDPNCFTRPAAGRYGNSGNNVIEGLGYWRYDAGLYKEFTFTDNERFPKFRITAYMMNPLNHPTKSISSNGPFIINSPSTVNRANDIVYDSGVVANLGASRIVWFEARILW